MDRAPRSLAFDPPRSLPSHDQEAGDMEFSRRQVLGSAGAVIGAAVAGVTPVRAEAQRGAAPRTRPADEPFGYCLNTSTVRGNNLDLAAEVAAAAKAGFNAIEPW